jgi:hypothetical protein
MNISFLADLFNIQPLFDSNETRMSSPDLAEVVLMKIKQKTNSVIQSKTLAVINLLLFMMLAS